MEAFGTPTGNIHCGYLTFAAPLLRCEIRSGLRPRPRKRASCEFDWAAGYSLTPRGTARVLCIGRAGHGFFLSRERSYRF